MKLRVALISPNRMDPTNVRDSLPGFMVVQAKNVIEFYQTQGGRPLDAFLFLDHAQLQSEFGAYVNFIRGKPAYKNTPIGVFTEKAMQLNTIIADSKVRNFTTETGLFLAIIGFLTEIESKKNLEAHLDDQVVQSQFSSALSAKLGKNLKINAREANADEAHSTFLSQMSEEIGTNLLWIKFSSRIVEAGSDGLKKMYKNLSEAEVVETSEKILKLILNEFKSHMETQLKTDGAVHFAPTTQIPQQEKNFYIKNAKSKNYLFETDICNVLLEVIRYI